MKRFCDRHFAVIWDLAGGKNTAISLQRGKKKIWDRLFSVSAKLSLRQLETPLGVLGRLPGNLVVWWQDWRGEDTVGTAKKQSGTQVSHLPTCSSYLPRESYCNKHMSQCCCRLRLSVPSASADILIAGRKWLTSWFWSTENEHRGLCS